METEQNGTVKSEPKVFSESDVKRESLPQTSDTSVSDSAILSELKRHTRKRSYSDRSDTDSSYDSEDSLQPVEQQFEQIIQEVNSKW